MSAEHEQEQPQELHPGDGGAMSAREVTGLVTLFVTMLAASEARIIAAMNENSQRAAERWAAHEKEHAAVIERLVDVERALHHHLDEEAREDLIYAARIRPFRTLGQRAAAHWRDILLAVLAILAILGVGTDVTGILK